ncbi:diacylglycerol/lipid kinase family protein [Jeotgalibacillus soli]|uniref:DAGKc domain-containing protein n=1 Tax=Jeotgalibacillus soli TaxID=889306 RepID=A0A0C2RQ68_9BACL|nr:diacylglycerol kinase family protein [Jeotgalibacillus soli]KIL43899.1 hypothetical protein KP78_37230 [Jeotgalibacillus soli]
MKKILVINPKAKNGKALQYFHSIESICKKEGIETWITESPGDASEKIRAWCEQNPEEKVLFIGMGGDGTMHEIINGVVAAEGENVMVACIPAGSGNDFARAFPSFQLTARSIKDLSLLNGKSESFDAAHYQSENNTGWFVNNLGIGFDALVAFSSNRSLLKKWLNLVGAGKLIYVFYLLRHLFTYRPTMLEIEVDGIMEQYSNVWFISVSNQPYYGGGMKISPKAIPQDGLLDLTIVHNLSRWKLLAVFLSVFKGSHLKYKEVAIKRGRVLQVKSDEFVRVHADGEDAGELAHQQIIHITVHQHKWKLFLPKMKGLDE